MKIFAQGTLVANGSEQVLTLFTELGELNGYVDLSQMQAGDSVVIRQYTRIEGAFSQYAEESYTGAQALPSIFITTKPGDDGIRVTLQQTAGVLRQFNYKFYCDTGMKISAGFRI